MTTTSNSQKDYLTSHTVIDGQKKVINDRFEILRTYDQEEQLREDGYRP